MSDKKSVEELKILVFEQNQATKQNKDRLFKLAKASNDIETIQKLANQYGFKSARGYIDKLDNLSVEDVLKSRDVEMLTHLIDNNIDLSSVDLNSLIVKKYNNEFIKLVIENGANINSSDEKGHTPLMMASYSGNLEIMKLLINIGVNIDAQANYGDTALIFACGMNDLKVVELLVKSNANLDIVNRSKNSALITAISHQNTDMGKILIENNCDINHQGQYGHTPLISAVHNQCIDVVQLLIKKGVDLDVQDEEGFSALLSCFSNEGMKKEIISLLVNAGANVNLRNQQGVSVLMHATIVEDKSIIKLLLNNDADADLIDNVFHSNSLVAACSNGGNEEIALLLIDYTNDLNLQSKDARSALLNAVNNNMINTVKKLLEAGANINIQNNSNGITPIMIACTQNNEDMVDLLLQNHPNLRLLDKSGLSVTEYAVNSMNYNIIKKVLDNGANQIRISQLKDDSLSDEQFSSRLKFASKIPLLARQLEEKIPSKEVAEQFILFQYSIICASRSLDDIDALVRKTKKPINEIDRFIQVHKESLDQIYTESITEDSNAVQVFDSLMKILNTVESEAKGYTLTSILEIIMNDYKIGIYSNKDFDDIVYDKNKNPYKYKLILENQFDGKSFVHIYEHNLIFHFLNSKNERWSREYKKISENTYHDENAGYILLVNNYIIEKTPAGRQRISKFIMTDEFDNIINHTRHNPKLLVNMLKRFSDDERLKYTNHDWDDSKLEYEQFMKNVKLGWNEIKDNLNTLLCEKAYHDIEKFLFEDRLGDTDSVGNLIEWGDKIRVGWSSDEIKKAGGKPHIFPISDDKSFKDVMNYFKSMIVIKQDSKALKLLKKFTKLRKDNEYDFTLHLDSLKDTDIENIFTDVTRLELALSTILSEINDRVDKGQDVKVVIEQNDAKTIATLKIIHIGSTSKSDADILEKAIEKGGFKGIYENLTSVCDWSIETICPDQKRYKVDYLYPEIDNDKPHSYPIDEQIEGFTHILRFYI